MTGPKKPPRRPPALDAPPRELTREKKRMVMPYILSAPRAEPAELTSTESSLLFAFRAMDAIARDDVHRFVLSMAMAHPRRLAPSLRVFEGGKQ